MNKIIRIGDNCYEVIGTIREDFMNRDKIQSKKETWTFDSLIYDNNNKLFELCNKIIDAEIIESVQ